MMNLFTLDGRKALPSGMDLWTPTLKKGKEDVSPFDIDGSPFFEVQMQQDKNVVLTGQYIPPKQKYKFFSPRTMLLLGRRDAGKTLTMTALAQFQKERYGFFHSPFKIASNYWLSSDLGDYYSAWIIDRIMDYPTWAKDMLCCIDEIQTAASSRRAMAKSNVLLGMFLTMIRKRRIEIVFTTQFPQVLDAQLLLQVDYFVECEKSPDAHSVRLYIHDYWGQFTGKFYRKPWPPMRYMADEVRTLYGTNAVFGKYRSGQAIASLYLNEEQRRRMVDAEAGSDHEWQERLPMLAAQDEMENRQALMEAMEIQAAVPRSLDELALRVPQRFNVMAFWDIVRAIEPSFKHPAAWQRFLTDKGFELKKEGRRTMAIRPQEASVG